MVNNFIFIFIHKRFERNKFNLLTNVLSQTSLSLILKNIYILEFVQKLLNTLRSYVIGFGMKKETQL